MPLKAIDVHVHLMDEVGMAHAGMKRLEVMSAQFGHEIRAIPVEELADSYRAREMMAVLLGGDDSTTSGNPPIPNAHVAQAMRDHPDVFIGFGGVDPWKGRLAIEEVQRIADLGLRGLKFNPGRQHFFPDDARHYPLWEAAAGRGLICLFHTGMMGNGAGTRGGLGFKLKYTRPIPHLDDIAADFPELTLISAHPGWPWQDEQLAMARHKANVYVDLSGWSPKYFPPQLVQQTGSLLQDRTLFGSDFPLLTPERWLTDFANLPYTDAVRHKILLANARALFGL
jgi:predicted TIM-barrel fold metal-dependent hydrolase